MYKEYSMKNVIKAFGLIVIVAVIGFSMVACGDNSGGGGGGLNGTWRNSDGVQVNISGSSGIISVPIGSVATPVWTSAVNRGYVKAGDRYWQEIKSTGNSKWAGKQLRVITGTNNVAVGTDMVSCTFTLSPDGLTLHIVAGSSSSSVAWTRQ